MSRVVAVVQARLGSTRLPGKVLLDVNGKPMLQHVVERLARSRRIDEVVIATSTDPNDKALLRFGEEQGFRTLAGSEDDVLDRYAFTAKKTDADVVVRVTADCPIIDPAVVDATLDFFFRENADYAANCIQQTFPRGLETEVFSRDDLLDANKRAELSFEREHVTPHFYLNPDRYLLRFLAAEGELRRPEFRLCVDTPEDFALLKEIFERLGPGNDFTAMDIVRLLDAHPELVGLNQAIRQKTLGE